jgi:hypothetical protein
MSDRWKPAKAVAVVILFGLMLYWAYFLSFHISLDDVRNVSPGFLRDEIDRAIARMPPGQRAGIDLPLPEVGYYGDTYKSPAVVIAGEMDAMPWIRDNTAAGDKFVADIFGAEVIMGMTTRVSTVGGDWANAPDPVRLMGDTNEIYKTDDPAKASLMAKTLNATLVYLPHRMLNTGWWLATGDYNASKFGDERYFREVYNASDVTIYRIL